MIEDGRKDDIYVKVFILFGGKNINERCLVTFKIYFCILRPVYRSMEVEQTGGWYLLTYVKEREQFYNCCIKLEFELMKLKTILPVVAVAEYSMCEPAVLLHAGTSDFISGCGMVP